MDHAKKITVDEQYCKCIHFRGNDGVLILSDAGEQSCKAYHLADGVGSSDILRSGYRLFLAGLRIVCCCDVQQDALGSMRIFRKAN